MAGVVYRTRNTTSSRDQRESLRPDLANALVKASADILGPLGGAGREALTRTGTSDPRAGQKWADRRVSVKARLPDAARPYWRDKQLVSSLTHELL